MEITDVRIKLIQDSGDRLRAFCNVTFDDQFVVRDIKIIDGINGLSMAMPSRKLTVPCKACSHRNQLRARFCEQCGASLPAESPPTDANGRTKQHRDIAHPITPAFRELLQNRILEAYRTECRRAEDPGYELGIEEAEVEEAPPKVEEAPPAMTEYDALIAGLRQAGDGAEGKNQSRSSSDTQRRREPRRDERREPLAKKEPQTSQERQRRPAAKTDAPPRERPTPSSAPAQANRGQRGADERHSVPRERIAPQPVEASPPPAPAPVAARPPRHEERESPRIAERPTPRAPLAVPPALPDSQEDSTPFGSGIL